MLVRIQLMVMFCAYFCTFLPILPPLWILSTILKIEVGSISIFKNRSNPTYMPNFMLFARSAHQFHDITGLIYKKRYNDISLILYRIRSSTPLKFHANVFSEFF